MRRIIVIAGLVAAGCMTTPAALRQKAPIDTYHTDKDPKLVTQCIADTLQALGVGTPRIVPAQNETNLSFYQGRATSIIFSITNYGTINVRRLHRLVPYHDAITHCI